MISVLPAQPVSPLHYSSCPFSTTFPVGSGQKAALLTVRKRNILRLNLGVMLPSVRLLHPSLDQPLSHHPAHHWLLKPATPHGPWIIAGVDLSAKHSHSDDKGKGND